MPSFIRKLPRKLPAFAFLFLLLCCGTAQTFTSSMTPLDPARCSQMRARGVISANPPVSCERLRVVKFSYVDFDGAQHDDGEMVVMDAVAKRARAVFETLLQRKFPLAKAVAMEHYQGDDNASMADNNTSAFNDRALTGGGAKSLHAYGLAIDINPIQNPYLAFAAAGEQGAAQFKPAAGAAYANRLNIRAGKRWRAGMAEQVVELFADNGFLTWGGYWDSPIDYQHFQIINRKAAERMAQMPFEQAEQYFEKIISFYLQCKGGEQNAADAAIRADCIERTEKAIEQDAL